MDFWNDSVRTLVNLLFHRNNEKQFEMVEERISECEDRSREIIQLEMKKKSMNKKWTELQSCGAPLIVTT